MKDLDRAKLSQLMISLRNSRDLSRDEMGAAFMCVRENHYSLGKRRNSPYNGRHYTYM